MILGMAICMNTATQIVVHWGATRRHQDIHLHCYKKSSKLKVVSR
jgi:hypothetical protein